MTRDDIIRMAREAGLELQGHGWIADDNGYPNLERFAQLVAAAEREECAKVCDELAELSRVADTDSMWEWSECAAAIRARGGV